MEKLKINFIHGKIQMKSGQDLQLRFAYRKLQVKIHLQQSLN
jgi:hypothetical protein